MSSVRAETVRILRPDGIASTERTLAVEAPVAVEVDGLGYAVMMMTPEHLAEFATGFMLTERLADTAADLVAVEPFEAEHGWIIRIVLAPRCRERVDDRVRHRTSDTSCGLCGISGLDQVRRALMSRPPPPQVKSQALFAALSQLRDRQPLNALTGAVHAAAACDVQGAITLVYEDVGRHNALDKLVGALALSHLEAAFVLVTSRISYEMVDKALVSRVPLLAGISAPTALAVERAREGGLTLVALARADAMLLLHDPWGWFDGG